MLFVEIFLLIFVLAISLFAFSLSLSFIVGPPYLPTPKKVIREMLDLIKVGDKDLVIDLGSGDGAILIEAALRGARTRGYEINPFLVFLTLFKRMIKRLGGKVSVHIQSYQKANLENATVIFCYNMPRFMQVIEKKIRKEAPKNVKIVSYKFPIPGLTLKKKTTSGIFLYGLKNKVDSATIA